MKMNPHSNFRLFLIRLLLITCFIGGIKSVPIDTEISGDSGPEAKNAEEEKIGEESKLSETVVKVPKALSVPFLPSIAEGETGKDSPASGLPGLPNFSSATAGGKLYLGTFQVAELPMPDASDFVNLIGNFGNLPTLPGLPNVPKIPGLPSLPGSGSKPSS